MLDSGMYEDGEHPTGCGEDGLCMDCRSLEDCDEYDGCDGCEECEEDDDE